MIHSQRKAPRSSVTQAAGSALQERETQKQRETYTFLRCHDWFMALGLGYVDRMLLPEKLRVVSQELGPSGRIASGGSSPQPGYLGVVLLDGRYLSAWDLGLMLGLESTDRSWLLMSVPFEGKILHLALRAGTCLSVGRLDPRQLSAIPRGVMRDGLHPFSATFDAKKAGARRLGRSPVGLVLDPSSLWSQGSFRHARKRLVEAGAPTA